MLHFPNNHHRPGSPGQLRGTEMFDDDYYSYDNDSDFDRNDQDGRLDGDDYCDEVERKAQYDDEQD